jgi:ribosomal protein S1
LRVETPEVSPRTLADLKPKMGLEGKVTKIELFGVFVDVGLDQPGLVHISQIRSEPLNRIEDVLQIGQSVEVWVKRVDVNAGRLELTMIPPIQMDWSDLKPGARVRGKVVRLEPFGAFVEIGAERPGLVHVSEMSDEYIRNPAEIAKIGDEVEVAVLEVNRKKRQIRLTMKIPEAEPAEDEEQSQEASVTPMEYALRRAMAEDAPPAPSPSRPSPVRRPRHDQEDIIARTLQNRVRASSSERKP